MKKSYRFKREVAEWELANVIIFGSQFVVYSIRQAGGPCEECRVAPYPMLDLANNRPIACAERSDSTDLSVSNRVLYLGTLQLRKGIHQDSRVNDLQRSQLHA